MTVQATTATGPVTAPSLCAALWPLFCKCFLTPGDVIDLSCSAIAFGFALIVVLNRATD
jgi:hypothetical protein